jgi:hypothetical protein
LQCGSKATAFENTSWDVTYGAPSIVKISGANAMYEVVATTAVRVTGTTCDLPPGTVLATFSGAGRSYVGKHGLWHRDCSFSEWTDMTFVLQGGTLTGTGSNGPVTFTERK